MSRIGERRRRASCFHDAMATATQSPGSARAAVPEKDAAACAEKAGTPYAGSPSPGTAGDTRHGIAVRAFPEGRGRGAGSCTVPRAGTAQSMRMAFEVCLAVPDGPALRSVCGQCRRPAATVGRSADARDRTGEVRQREAAHDASRQGVRARASPPCAAGMDSACIGIFFGTGKAVMESLRRALARGAAAGVGTMTGCGAGEARSGGGGLRGSVPVGDIPARARRGSTACPGGPDCAGRTGTTPETHVKTSGYAGLQAARDGSARDGLTPDNCCYRAPID